MKRLLLRALFFLIPFLWSIYASSQPKGAKDCSTTCFSSQVVSQEKISASCTAYELKVSFAGQCAHALSHYSVAIPCGNIDNIWNSQNWKIERGTDPTTGADGFKIDDIAGFGDGPLSSFTVTFTLCAQSEDCASELACWQPVVAYKASTCVNYETLAVNCKSLKATLGKQDAGCYGTASGSLSIVVEDGHEPYTFKWSDGSSEPTRTDLPAGDYSVIVSDASGEQITLEETLSQGEQIIVTGNSMPASCNGVANGSIDITVSGGSGPYAYSWTNGATSEDPKDLLSGQYTVIVTDSRNCTTTANFTIANNSSISVSAIQQKPDCNSANGAIDITVSGGTSPYSFLWSNGAASEDISAIGEGVYTVTITDVNGCKQEKSFFLKENNTLALQGTTTPTSCVDDASGSVNLSITGGTSPYTFTWSNGETTEDITEQTSGYYTVTVKDAKGCSVNGGFVVSKTTFQIARTVVQPTCFGENNGSITLQEPVGGTGPFNYEWSNGETTTSISDLAPGSYSVTITDATGCSRTVASTIFNPFQISASVSVSNTSCDEDGSYAIDLTASGGIAPYKYEWSNGTTTEDLNGVTDGTYTVVITDSHGCSLSKEIVVERQNSAWSCLISEPSAVPSCGSTNNIITTPVADADSYSWSVQSTDGSWTISNENSASVTFTTGEEGSTATFTLVITKDGCTRTCTYVATSCIPHDNGEGEDPDGEDPGGEQPGEEEPGEGSQTCEECFDTTAELIDVSGDCRTYEMVVNTNGLCRHDLSHWTLAIPCGTVTASWNSEGWKMEFGKDPTTGLHGLKVDDINSFGKEASSFTVRFTLCENNGCDLSSWTPAVAYKAGLCVGFETISMESPSPVSMSVYPNPFSEVVNFEWNAHNGDVSIEIIDQYGNTVSRSTTLGGQHKVSSLKLETLEIPKGMYYYRMSLGGEIYTGKISKR